MAQLPSLTDIWRYYLRPETYPVKNDTKASGLQDAAVVCSSFLFSCSMYLVSAIFATTLSSTYRYRLKGKERFFWHVTLLRALFGFWATREGLWAIFQDTELHQNVAHGCSPRAYFDCLVALGFFLFEGVTVTGADFVFGKWQLLLNLHHWLGVICGLAVVLEGRLLHLAVSALVLEMSTPFSGLCWVLIKMDWAKTTLWKANQFLLLHVFHLRSVVECYLWYISYNQWNQLRTEVHRPSFWLCYGSMFLVSALMTPYWTYRKTLQFVTGEDWNFEVKDRTMNGDSKKIAASKKIS